MLLFLDDHFDNHDIDKDPAKKAIKYIRASLCTVYDKYEQYCKKCVSSPLRLHVFSKNASQKNAMYSAVSGKVTCIFTYYLSL